MIRLGVSVAPGLVDEEPHSPCVRLVPGDDDSALACGHVLALLQAEAADVADRPDQASIALRPVGLRCVLDDGQVVSFGQLEDGTHAARVAEQVRDDDRPGTRGDPGSDRLGGDVVGQRVDVGEHGDRGLVDDRRQRSDVGDRSRDDLVTGLRIDAGDRRVDGRGARRGGATESDAVERGEPGFELLHGAALGAVQRPRQDDSA